MKRPRDLKRGRIESVRYGGRGEDRSTPVLVRGEGWDWSRRLVRLVHLFGGREVRIVSSSAGSEKKGMYVTVPGMEVMRCAAKKEGSKIWP